MLITKLQIAGLRSIEQAEFTFQPGMNLIVGINGVGKTTVLDALRICLSRILPEITSSKSQKHNFRDADVRNDAEYLNVQCIVKLGGIPVNILVRKYKRNAIDAESGKLSLQLQSLEDIQPALSKVFSGNALSQQPLAVYFSTKRALITEQKFTTAGAVGRQASAFADSLSSNRELNLRLHAEWFKTQIELGKENPLALKHVEVLCSAVNKFLPDFQDLHVIDSKRSVSFEINKNGSILQVTQLSDGERNVLSLVLDIARRLSQANPGLEDPVKEGVAVVLIDELDLHLHPKWQRTIVENLTRTFPNCQFIATTHSPQIIGEVPPDRITIIGDSIYHPVSSFGLDSSRVLEEIMDADSRNAEVDELMTSISRKIDSEELAEAKRLLNQLKQILRPDDPEVIRSETMIDFLESDVIE